jgi:predicted DsbA family dithiol-disulfide isomerase
VEIAFAHQDALERASLVTYASQANLDVSRFTRDLDSDETARTLAQDESLALKLDVKGTPTSFVEGKLIVGAQLLPTFEDALH